MLPMIAELTMTHVLLASTLVGVAAFFFLQIGALHSRISRSRQDLDAFKIEVAHSYPNSELLRDLNGNIRALNRTISNGHPIASGGARK